MARAVRRQRRQMTDGEDNSYNSDNSTGSASQSEETPAADTLFLDEEDESLRRPLPIHQTNVPRVACAILASITTGGTTYAFGLYGGALKKKLHLTQSQLDTISAVFFSAGLLSFIPGAIVDRFGSRNAICTGSLTGATSLMLFWGVAKGHFSSFLPKAKSDDGDIDPTMAVTILSILSVGIFLSCALVTGSVFKVISCQCGQGSKGSAVGVAKGFVGLGSGAYSCLFQAIKHPTTSDLDFLPLCAFFFIAVGLIPSWMGLPSKANETFVPDVLTPKHFKVLYASLATLAMLIIYNSLVRLYEDSHNSGDTQNEDTRNYFMAGLLLFVWIAPIVSLLYLPQRPDWEPESSSNTATRNTAEYEQITLLDEERHNDSGGSTNHRNDDSNSAGISLEQFPMTNGGHNSDDEEASNSSSESSRGSSSLVATAGTRGDKNLFQMLQTPSAWMMLWVTTILTGGGTVETNNLGQMVESLGFNTVVTPATVALFSVAQSGGRIITGALSEAALTYETQRCCIEKGIPRPFFFVAASMAAVLAHTILAVATDQILFVIGITFSGIAFGMIWPLMVLCVAEFYGTIHVGANYMFYDGFTSAAGTFLLSKVVAQEVYEDHIIHSETGGDGVTCYGIECFQKTHLLIVLLSLTCVVVSMCMQYKTRMVYKRSHV